MASRETFSGSSTPPVSGPDYLDQVAERFDTLFDASCLPLTAVGGTGDAVTATLDPPLVPADTFVDGMKFTITWGAANTAGVTLAINGGTPLPVLDASGAALAADALTADLRSLIEYIGGAFRVLSSAGAAGGASASYYWQFTANGTWTKPAGLNDNRMVFVEAWGGGAGGTTGPAWRGGGGGGWSCRWIRAGDLPASVAVTIGAGGAVSGNGGNTSFGSVLTAYGAIDAAGGSAAPGGLFGGSPGSGGGAPAAGLPATTEHGGGGGSSGTTTAGVTPGPGGPAFRGGGGGAGRNGNTGQSNSGGTSIYGGAGGASLVAGTAPGGGGGANAAGARGEVRVWI